MAPLLGAVVTPLFLYAGGAAASIPVLIHLLSRRRFRRVRWAAIDFLLEADRRNRRRVRIEEMILLALRCLAMFLVGALLARVFLRPEALAAVLGSPAPTERIIVLDDSFSMGLAARGQGGREPDPAAQTDADAQTAATGATVFRQGTAAVERLVRWLAGESPNDPLTIILTSRPDQPIRADVNVGETDFTALSEELGDLEPSYRGGNMPATFTALRRLLDSRESALNAAVYVVSDFQQRDWSAAASGGPSATEHESPSGAAPAVESPTLPGASLAGWADGEHELRVILVDVGVDDASNLCVTRIVSRQPQAVAGVAASYTARVTNFAPVASKPRDMNVFVGQAAQPPIPVPAIRAGQTVDVPFEVTFSHEGSKALTVELARDPLPVDNTRSAAVSVTRALRVLIVNGEAAADPYDDEVYLLTVALRPEGPQFSGNDVTVIEENELDDTDLANFHVVLLANVFRVTEETADRLSRYVADGGGLAIFLGDQVDAELYNRVLYREGDHLLPARLGEPVFVPGDRPGVRIGGVDRAHPFIRLFGDTAASHFADVLVQQYFACQVPGEATTAPAVTDGIVSPAEPTPDNGDTQEAGPPRVLVYLDDPDSSPLIVERSYGEGRVWLVSTSADKEWSNLPDHPVFIVLTIEMIQYLAREPGDAGTHLVGEPIALKLDPGRYQPMATLQTPAYPDEPATRIEAQPDPLTGTPVVHWSQTDLPGVYAFELIETAGGQRLEQVSVGLDPTESDLDRADRSVLTESFPGVDVAYVTGETLVTDNPAQARRELWSTMLIALAAVLMLEQTLARWFGAQR